MDALWLRMQLWLWLWSCAEYRSLHSLPCPALPCPALITTNCHTKLQTNLTTNCHANLHTGPTANCCTNLQPGQPTSRQTIPTTQENTSKVVVIRQGSLLTSPPSPFQVLRSARMCHPARTTSATSFPQTSCTTSWMSTAGGRTGGCPLQASAHKTWRTRHREPSCK